MTESSGRRRILFICTANICRSPAAELLARNQFSESNMLFRSAGFLRAGSSCPQELVTVLGELGADAGTHRSYQVDAASLRAADLALTMEGEHVQKATMVLPEAFPKIVPLREAAQVLSSMPHGTSLDEFLAELNQDRDPRNYLGNQWDVADPYGGRIRGYRRAANEINDLVATTIGRLR